MKKDLPHSPTLDAGQVVRIEGQRGLFRAVEPCKDRQSGKNWWFLGCDSRGTWDQKHGWRAFPVTAATPVKGRKAKA